MKKFRVTARLLRRTIFLSLLTLYGCIEPYAVENFDFEDILVVEATLTDQNKQQEVYLGRTYPLDQSEVSTEQGATVAVEAEGASYTFSEVAPGLYRSDQSFAAEAQTAYKLFITTKSGHTFESAKMTLPPASDLQDIKAERLVNKNGDEGIGIFVESQNSQGNSRNYRYQFEETFKIVAPYWTGQDLVAPDENSCEVSLVNDNRSARECFMANSSKEILQYSTSNLVEDKVDHYMVRFLNKDNYSIAKRYSILVKQYVQSNEAYAYYETLNEYAGQESPFTGSQPGFLEGNITYTGGGSGKVIGFFEVSSEREKRIFFNYSDFFDTPSTASYVEECIPNAPALQTLNGTCHLSVLVRDNAIRYLRDNDEQSEDGEDESGPYMVVPRACGDCSIAGTVEAPEFWEEE